MIARRFAVVAPLAAVLTAGCFATRNDVRLLQQDIARMQATLAQQRTADERARLEEAREDSLRAEEVREIARLLSISDDSLRSLMRQFGIFRVNASEDLGALRSQLIQVQAQQGASQQRLAELQKGLESRPVVPPVVASDSANAAAVAQAASDPGPEALYQQGFALLTRGSHSVARATLGEVVAKHPNSEAAPMALLRIGESYSTERDSVAADSVWSLVVEKYPRSRAAPTALYKRANALAAARDTRRALELYDRIIRDYAGSPERPLADERAKALRGQ